MPTLLSPDLVSDALTVLAGWTGDEKRISRTVPVTGEQASRLKDLVQQTADAINHHPVVEDGEGTITFQVWSHSAGGVTLLDVVLAARIDGLIEQAR